MSTGRGKGEIKITLNTQDRSIKFYKTSGTHILHCFPWTSQPTYASLFTLSFISKWKIFVMPLLMMQRYEHTYFSKMLGATFLLQHTHSTQLLPTGQSLLFIVFASESYSRVGSEKV